MELKMEIEGSRFVVCSAVAAFEVVDDVVIRTKNGHSISLKELLEELGEL